MDQNMGNRPASDDASEAREHVRNAEENRDALAAQNQRTESSAPDSVDTPVGGGQLNTGTRMNDGQSAGTSTSGSGGLNATGGRPSDDASEARENVRAAEDNRDALADQNRRVESSTPPDVNTTGR